MKYTKDPQPRLQPKSDFLLKLEAWQAQEALKIQQQEEAILEEWRAQNARLMTWVTKEDQTKTVPTLTLVKKRR